MTYRAYCALCLAAAGLLCPELAVAAGKAGSAAATAAHGEGRVLVRRYEVQADAETGRLVRVAHGRRFARSGGPESRAASGKLVVQGQSGSRRKDADARVSIESLVKQAGRRHGVAPELIHAVIRQESGYNPFAISQKGARGLMQLLPQTAEWLGVQDIFDPAENVEGGVKLLRYLLDRYEGDEALALAAYNAGQGAVEEHGGIPPFQETVDYVRRVRRMAGSSAASGTDRRAGEASGSARIRVWVDASGVTRFEMERE